MFSTIKFSIDRLVFFKKQSKIHMLQSILAFHHESNVVFLIIQSFSYLSPSVLNLPKDTYEDYLAFLFEVNLFFDPRTTKSSNQTITFFIYKKQPSTLSFKTFMTRNYQSFRKKKICTCITSCIPHSM